MKRILLVAPEPLQVQHYTTMKEVRSLPFKAIMLPLGIATVAALTPDDMEVHLWDEPVHGRIDEDTELPDYDLVGVTGLRLTFPRMKEIAQVFRRRGIPVAVGGPGVSSSPGRYRNDFDILFIGEAELTWPRFIADWRTGSYSNEYRQITRPDLAYSPPPRWEGLADQMDRYLSGTIQTSRGCPFDCEFCESIPLFGHGMRFKPIDRVLEEIAALERLGIHYAFFCDDNLAGNPGRTKDLLRELLSLNNSFKRPMEFVAQLSIDVAKDEEMLKLFADSNFSMFVIGIETPNKESLRETHKYHNVHSDLIEDCRTIQSYGLLIRAAMSVGYDHDTPEVFDQQLEFLQEAGIPLASVTVLKAAPGTKLWRRLREEGRVLKTEDAEYNSVNFALTNIVPKRMSRIELFSGYGHLVERIYDWKNFTARVKKMMSYVKRKPNIPTKRLQWKGFFQLPSFLLSMDKDARGAILRILWYTLQHAPFMVRRLFVLVVQQYGYFVMMQASREPFYEGIEVEKSLDIEQWIDRSGIGVPGRFKGPYREMFPDIHQRIYQGLTDKTRTCEALIKVFTGFLLRWSRTPEDFSDQHRSLLHELADRTIAEENNEGSGPSGSIPDGETGADTQNEGLADDILRFVEQELRRQCSRNIREEHDQD